LTDRLATIEEDDADAKRNNEDRQDQEKELDAHESPTLSLAWMGRAPNIDRGPPVNLSVLRWDHVVQEQGA
jgi:hypothetical protein